MNDLETNISDLMQIGVYYEDASNVEIENLDQLIVNVSDFKQESFYNAFHGVIHKYDISEKWQVNRHSKPYCILDSYTLEELGNILKGEIVYETFIGHGRSSITASVPVYFEIAIRDYSFALSLLRWSEKFGFDNSYFPYGTRSHLEFNQFMYKYSTESDIIKKFKLELQVAGYIRFDNYDYDMEKKGKN